MRLCLSEFPSQNQCQWKRYKTVRQIQIIEPTWTIPQRVWPAVKSHQYPSVNFTNSFTRSLKSAIYSLPRLHSHESQKQTVQKINRTSIQRLLWLISHQAQTCTSLFYHSPSFTIFSSASMNSSNPSHPQTKTPA